METEISNLIQDAIASYRPRGEISPALISWVNANPMVNLNNGNKFDSIAYVIEQCFSNADGENDKKIERFLETFTKMDCVTERLKTLVEKREIQTLNHLMYNAVTSSFSSVCKALIKNGFNVDSKVGNNGDRALHFAVQNSCYGIVEDLLKAGADTEAKNNAGQKPLEVSDLEDREYFGVRFEEARAQANRENNRPRTENRITGAHAMNNNHEQQNGL